MKLKLTTTKKLTWRVFSVWLFTIIAYYICLIIFNLDTVVMVTTTSASMSVVLTGYFTKAFFENKEKYGKSENEKTDNNENDINNDLGC